MPTAHSCPGTHRRCTVAGVGVVLDLPETLIEAFPLVGLPVLVLALVIGKQILGSQEGPGERNHRPVPGETGYLRKEASLWVDTENLEGTLTSHGFQRRRWDICWAVASRHHQQCHQSAVRGRPVRGLQVRARRQLNAGPGNHPVTWWEKHTLGRHSTFQTEV